MAVYERGLASETLIEIGEEKAMKRICGVAGATLLTLLTGCASYVVYQVRLPVVLGIGAEQTNIQVMNNTPFTADVFAVDKRVTLLKPGEVAEALEFVPVNGQPEPLVAFLYEEVETEDGTETAYVGVARAIPQLTRGGASVWAIRVQDIAFTKAPRIALVEPRLAGFPKRVHFTHTYTHGILTVQFVNNSRYTVELKSRASVVGMAVCKKGQTLVNPGGLCVFQAQQFYYQQPGRFYIQARYLDDGRFVRDEFFVFTTSPIIVTAHQVIL